MKKLFAVVLAAAMVLTLAGTAVAGTNGNGAPSGAHYNLNIIGVPNELNENFDGGNGARIFILRTGTTRVYVGAGDAYEVLDHDGTDGEVGEGGALQNPLDPNYAPGIIFPYDYDTGLWQADIWVRLVGPNDPNNKLDIETSYFDGAYWVPYATINLEKSSKFQMKGRELLADGYENVLWELDPGTKFRICQMRVYLVDREAP